MSDGISIIIPTYNGGATFGRCLEAIRRQDYPGDVQLIVIDSGSGDGTKERAEAAGAAVKQIDKKQFHHGRTRNAALGLARHPFVLFTVQDAVPLSDRFLWQLTQSLKKEKPSAVYARQVPHEDAELFAHFEVTYHSEYLGHEPRCQWLAGDRSLEEMTYDDLLRLVRLDNVCAAYPKDQLMDSPFPEVDFGEDMAWAMKTIAAGGRILYRPDIVVRHSHNRPPEYRFRRTIVDSVSCAKILQRVREDLSDFTVSDLIALTDSVRRHVSIRKAEIIGGKHAAARNGRPSDSFRRIVKRYSFPNRLRRILLSLFVQGKMLKSARFAIWNQAMKNHIDHVLHLIRERYPDAPQHGLTDAVDQAAASITGRIYGEVYASRLLKRIPSPAVENLVRPYMADV